MLWLSLFSDEATETQRGYAACPKLNSYCVSKLGLEQYVWSQSLGFGATRCGLESQFVTAHLPLSSLYVEMVITSTSQNFKGMIYWVCEGSWKPEVARAQWQLLCKCSAYVQCCVVFLMCFFHTCHTVYMYWIQVHFIERDCQQLWLVIYFWININTIFEGFWKKCFKLCFVPVI